MMPVRMMCVAFLAAIFLSGCAASRSEVEVSVPKPTVTPTKAAVKITEVTDKRRFEVDPRSPLTPSIRGNEIDNKQLTARAVGRKRGGFGNAWGDVVLPEGQTVSGLVAQVLEAALIEKGYAVIPNGASGYDTALPLSAEVIKFWSWVSPGFATISVSQESLVRLVGPWPVKDNVTEVHGSAHYEGLAIVESDWANVLTNGAKYLQENLADSLK